ncbi:MAG: hypothetical protein ABSF74_06265 [Dehalococcoidia bacterium]|jgi:hypothetical protein
MMPRKTISAICKYRAILEGKDLPYPKHRYKYVEIELDGFIVQRPILKSVRNSRRLPMLIAFAASENPEHKIRLRFDESGYYVVGYRRIRERKGLALMVV